MNVRLREQAFRIRTPLRARCPTYNRLARVPESIARRQAHLSPGQEDRMPYARTYPHRRRLFPRRRYTRRYSRYSRRRRLPSDMAILAVFAIVLIIIALATR